jgi:chemotaxis protein histidine kinase CheA
MGMKIVFDVLEILKGDLVLESQINKGTNVRLIIPLSSEIV